MNTIDDCVYGRQPAMTQLAELRKVINTTRAEWYLALSERNAALAEIALLKTVLRDLLVQCERHIPDPVAIDPEGAYGRANDAAHAVLVKPDFRGAIHERTNVDGPTQPAG